MKLVRIQNFQKHKDLTVEFDPHITTLVGATDSGKSALLRALRWVMRLDPKGYEFIRHGSKKTIVDLEVDNHVIHRERSKTVNLYSLDGEEYKAFGNDVPIDIQEVLNVSDLNFQGQHDGVFWFSETAGEVSRQLNKIVDLSKIDTTLSAMDSILRKTKVEVEVSKERMTGLKARGYELRYIKQADAEFAEVESLQAQSEKISESAWALASSLSGVTKHDGSIQWKTRAHEAAEKATEAGEAWKGLREKRDKLLSTIHSIEELTIQAELPIPPSTAKLEQLASKAEELGGKADELHDYIEKLEQGEEELCQKEKSYEGLKVRLDGMLGTKCPLCGNKIKS